MSTYSTYSNYEADEIYSSSSSSLSFENNESSSHSHQYYNHYQNPSIHCDMNEHHHYQQQQQQTQGQQPNLAFKDSDWPISKSPQPSFIMSHRDDLYSPVDAGAPSYSSYDNYENSVNSHFSAVPMNDINMQQPEPTIYNSMSWSSNNDTTTDTSNNVGSPTNVSPSPGFCLPIKKQQQQFQHGNHFMDMFPLPPPSPQHQQQQYHLSGMDMFSARPYSKDTTFILNKGERYHPRFKSANARLSPFTEQQDLYQRLLSVSSSSSPPQHYHPLVEEQTTIKGEEHEGGGALTAQQQFYHNYQSEQEFTSSNSARTDQTKFQFDVVLHASTAVHKKQDEQPVTYLNRGQAYLINLRTNSPQHQEYPAGTMSSTLSIAFHESSHRQIAENYWKYWISQQENPKEAKAIGLDTNQTTGIYNIRQVAFDRITFDWNGRFGAKVYVHFNCLSTDFSRIKGVKGIPLRCVMETRANYLTLPDDSMLYNGTFHKENEAYQYREICYCKIKLFRDKGAERKNKDDKKQIAKQMEKVIASTNGNPQQHPLWPIISQSHRPTSVLSEVPTSPDILLEDFDDITSGQELNLMAPLTGVTDTTTTATSESSFTKSNSCNSNTRRKRTTNDKIAKKGRDKSNSGSSGKRARTMEDSPTIPSSGLTFYIWTRHVHSTPQEICLEQLTTHNLKMKLGQVLCIHPARISEILWKRKRAAEQQESSSDVLVLVEDTFISEHIVDGEMMTVDLEIKADGNLRLVLEF